MARPRVFVSSTYFDLKHIHSSLEVFIESLGYDAVLSERGDITYAFDVPLDESCYREASNSDIFVLIVGGRYGSEVSETKGDSPPDKKFFDPYESITKREYESAANRGIPIFILVEKSVHAEFQTFQKNRENETVNYAHVSSANVFRFIDGILAKRQNNPIFFFERHAEIESWLREQWAGLFRNLIHQTSTQKQLTSLSAQVEQLTETNTTLKRYVEKLLTSAVPGEESKALIESESKRLNEVQRFAVLTDNYLVQNLHAKLSLTVSEILNRVEQSESLEDLVDRILAEHGELDPNCKEFLARIKGVENAQMDFFILHDAIEELNKRSSGAEVETPSPTRTERRKRGANKKKKDK